MCKATHVHAPRLMTLLLLGKTGVALRSMWRLRHSTSRQAGRPRRTLACKGAAAASPFNYARRSECSGALNRPPSMPYREQPSSSSGCLHLPPMLAQQPCSHNTYLNKTTCTQSAHPPSHVTLYSPSVPSLHIPPCPHPHPASCYPLLSSHPPQTHMHTHHPPPPGHGHVQQHPVCEGGVCPPEPPGSQAGRQRQVHTRGMLRHRKLLQPQGEGGGRGEASSVAIGQVLAGCCCLVFQQYAMAAAW